MLNNDMHIDDTLQIDEASLMLVEGPNTQMGQGRDGCGFPAESPHNPNLPLLGPADEGNLNDSTLE